MATAVVRWAMRAVLCGVVVAALAACGGGSDDDNGKSAPLTILHINDQHSALASKTATLQLPVDGKTTAVTVDAAGFPRVTAAIEELAARSDSVLKLHAGDAITGTLYFNRAGADGEADMAMMSTVCFDAYTLGNHEFDKGDTGLNGILERLRTGGCNTPVLSANVQFGASSALNPSRTSNLVKPSVVLERGGHKVGIIGLTIAQKTKASSSPDKDTNFEDETTAAQREIDALRAKGDPLGEYQWVYANAMGWVDNPVTDPEALLAMYLAAAEKGSSDARVAAGILLFTGWATPFGGSRAKLLPREKFDMARGLALIEAGTRERCWYWQPIIMTLRSQNCLRPVNPAMIVWPDFRDGGWWPKDEAAMQVWKARRDQCEADPGYRKADIYCH